MTETKTKGFLGFPFLYWLANGLELLERGAFYGLLAVFSFHVTANLGYTMSFAGLAIALLKIPMYFVPIIAAPLTLKFGYRRSLLVLFVFLAGGYAIMGYVSSQLGILIGLMVFGTAAGVFKPIIASVVGRTTTEENRNRGYGLYYWMINAGAFLVPLVIGLTIPEEQFRYVFFLAAALIAVNLVVTFLLFRDPDLPKERQTVAQALGGLRAVLAERRFTILVLLYSGFWFMYSANHVILPVYMRDFTNMPTWFNVALVGTINPGTIILLGPVLSKIVDRFHALPTMIVGMVIFLAGFTLIGFWPIWLMFFLGIFIASIGEFVVHPSFLSHVAGTSPKDKVDLYLGAVFLSVGIGYFTGSLAGGFLYDVIALDWLMPNLFWAIMISVGVLTAASILIYNRIVQGPEARRALVSPVSRFLVSRRAAVLITAMVPALLLAGVLAPTLGPNEGDDLSVTDGYRLATKEYTTSGNTAEGTATRHVLKVTEPDVVGFTLTLTWTDEAPENAGTPLADTNQPDTFRVTVTTPDGTERVSEEVANAVGEQGVITVGLPAITDRRTGELQTGDYTVTVELVEAGDQTSPVPLVPVTADDGNAWELGLVVDHWVKDEVEPVGPKV